MTFKISNLTIFKIENHTIMSTSTECHRAQTSHFLFACRVIIVIIAKCVFDDLLPMFSIQKQCVHIVHAVVSVVQYNIIIFFYLSIFTIMKAIFTFLEHFLNMCVFDLMQELVIDSKNKSMLITKQSDYHTRKRKLENVG